jgi:osmotically-inducible protein OsmY
VKISIVALLVLFALGACSAGQQRQAQDSAQDAVLAGSVMTKLASVDVDAVTAIRVTASGGTVTISGQARSLQEKSQYVAAARTISGVDAIDDRIAVNPHLQGLRQQGSDAVLAGRVASAIAAQTGINVLRISTTAKSGVVTLRGTVPTKAIEQTVIGTARGVSGVRAVVSQMRVGGT